MTTAPIAPDLPGSGPTDADITCATLEAVSSLASQPRTHRVRRAPLPTLSGNSAIGVTPLSTPQGVGGNLRFSGGRTARLHNAVMEEIFTAMRASAGAAAALAAGPVPERGGIPVFRCSVAHSATAPIDNPSQPSHSVNFYEIVPTLDDGAPVEPGTPLAPGVWTVTWTCPTFPPAHGGPAAGAFHIGVGVDEDALPEAWASNAGGRVTGAPGNVTMPALGRGRLTSALRRLAATRDLAERDGCAVMVGFVASKAARVRNAHPALFDRDDALQEGLAKLVVLMRKFASRARPRACWSVAAGLVLERDLPRAADRVGHLPSNLAHCAHWLAKTDTLDHRDPHLTPELAAAAYALDQRRRQNANPRTRAWLNDGHPTKPAFSLEVWRLAIVEARRGRPVSLDKVSEPHGADAPAARLGDLVPALDREIELVGERTLVDLLDDLLVGTGLTYDDLRGYLHPRLARRDYPDDVLGGPSRDDGSTTPQQARDAAEDRLLGLVTRPSESLARHRSVLRARVRSILFDHSGRYRPTEDRKRLWEEHRAAASQEVAMSRPVRR
jgi:hypothetical protein